MAMDGASRLFIMMIDSVYRYCLYEIGAPDDNDDELSIYNLGKPLLKMKGSKFPDHMSFVGLDSRIFMIGGFGSEGDDPPRAFNNTFIFDTRTKTCIDGPPLVSGKSCPHLFTIGSKIYALSRFIDCDVLKSSGMDPQRQFEVLDTKDIGCRWSALPVPMLQVSSDKIKCSIDACGASYVDGGGGAISGFIFISLREVGTYAFNTDKEVWNYVGSQMLPFRGHATSISLASNRPRGPSLCYAPSSKSQRYSGFRFHYSADVFRVDEVEMDISTLKSPPLPPRLFHVRPLTVFGSSSQVFYITSGCDNLDGINTHIGNRYVKVSAVNLRKVKKKRHEEEGDEMVKFKSNKGPTLKRCKRELKKEMESEGVGDEGKTVEPKKKKRHEGEPSETVKLDLNKGQFLKRCKKTKSKREMGMGTGTGILKGVEEEEEILKMTSLWRKCIFGGPMCHIFEHVTAAFAM